MRSQIGGAREALCDTPKASSANAGRIERASQKVEKRSGASRSWVSVECVCKVMPDTVRNCAWQMTRRFARPGRVKQIESRVDDCATAKCQSSPS